MNGVLVDSDILIEVTRARDPAVLARWGQLGDSQTPVLCSPVTIAELWHGAFPREELILTNLFVSINCVPIDALIGERAGKYQRNYAKGHHLELGDALIAATASIHNLLLWTRNRRHYPMKDVEFY